jgi:hypothetical protein
MAVPAARLTYEFVYELQSLALAWGISARELWTEVRHKCKTETPTLEQRIAAYRSVARDSSHEKFTLASWDAGAGLPPEKVLHRSIYQEVDLLWSKSRVLGAGLFDIRLRAPRIQKSCRFHRKFDGRRFLTLNLPDWKSGTLSSTTEQEYYEAVSDWLCDGIQIGHRYWRPFWVEGKPVVNKDGDWIYQVHLYATTGLGLEDCPISLRDFLD